MNSNFSMKEDFDVSFVPSEAKETQNLEFKGVCEVKHVRDGNLLSLDIGENVITNSGKIELVKMMAGTSALSFTYIGIGRRGDIGATVSDTTLGGSAHGTYNETQGSYAVGTGGGDGCEYQQPFVKPRQIATATAVKPRITGNDSTDSTELAVDDAERFYVEIQTTGGYVAFAGDTCLWSAKYVFTGISTAYPTPATDTVIINEAGIFNKGIGDDGGSAPDMLARRTFSNKPVKDADELTIKWKITIK